MTLVPYKEMCVVTYKYFSDSDNGRCAFREDNRIYYRVDASQGTCTFATGLREMGELIKHECGIGLVRLRKPFDYYHHRYGSALWGLNKLYLLMEKQHNRGQDGAGLAAVRINAREGSPFYTRARNNQTSPWANLFKDIRRQLTELQYKFRDKHADPAVLYEHFDFAGEVLMAHLRYGTHGDNTINACHPVARSNNWRTHTLLMAGNFNLTNVGELFNSLLETGQHPRFYTDTETVLEGLGQVVDQEIDRLVNDYVRQGGTVKDAYIRAGEKLDIRHAFARAAHNWDGGYAMMGMLGHGDAFVARDIHGIRPAFYAIHEDVIVAASERPAISTVFDIPYDRIHELQPGHMLIVKADGSWEEKAYREPAAKQSCSFERIYFSRGNDRDIYRERIALGKLVTGSVLEAIDYDVDNTVFSYIPNTAEIAYLGMVKGIETYINERKIAWIRENGSTASETEIRSVLEMRPRAEKAVLKDVKLRTFITDDSHRDDLVAHVYDITEGSVQPGKDNFVVIDDSIVRGTTLKVSILKILSRLRPKRIVVVSSAPQIRYPDCYGIDMSQIGRFVAFQAAIALLRERGMEKIIHETHATIRAMEKENLLESRNAVKAIYEPFTESEISAKITQILTPEGLNCPVTILYQPLANLRHAIPNHTGDWYFSGNYPTPGGNRVVNQAFLNWYEGSDKRAY